MALDLLDRLALMPLPSGLFRVLFQYVKHANADGEAWPSLAELAACIGIDPTNVKRQRAEATRRGYLQVTKRVGHAVVYRVTLPPLERLQAEVAARRRALESRLRKAQQAAAPVTISPPINGDDIAPLAKANGDVFVVETVTFSSCNGDDIVNKKLVEPTRSFSMSEASFNGNASEEPGVSPLASLGSKTRRQEQPQRQAKGQRRDDAAAAREVLAYLNLRTGHKYRPVAATLRPIEARLREGASPEDCRAVIDAKTAAWATDPKMAPYLRPETLFGASKFAGYVGQLGSALPLADAAPESEALRQTRERLRHAK